PRAAQALEQCVRVAAAHEERVRPFERLERAVVPAQVNQLEPRALGRRGDESGPDALEVGHLVVQTGGGDERDASARAEESWQGGAAPRTERPAGVEEDAARAHARSRRSWAMERTM